MGMKGGALATVAMIAIAGAQATAQTPLATAPSKALSPADASFHAFVEAAAAKLPKTAPDSWAPVSEAVYDAQIAELEQREAALNISVRRDALSQTGQRDYDIYKAALHYGIVEGRLKKRAFFISGNVYNDAINLGRGMERGVPFKSADEARTWLTRLDRLPAALGQYEALAGERRARGVVMIRGMYPQVARGLRAFAAGAECGAEGSNPFAEAFARRAKDLPDADKTALTATLKSTLSSATCQSFSAFADRVAALEPGGRTQGLWNSPGGLDDYRDLVELNLGERVDPDRVHADGLAEAAKLKAEILKEAQALGFTGDIGELPSWLGKQPGQFIPAGPDAQKAYVARAETLLAEMEKKLPGKFSVLPQGKLVVGPTPRSGSGSAQYFAAPADGTRPAEFSLTPPASDPMPIWALTTLSYHEGVPGHHLQQDRARDIKDLPGAPFTYYPAFTEGWAVYAEALADEMGGHATPYERIGWLHYTLEVAVRLAVDSGINFKGWTAEKAADYQQDMLGKGAPTGTGRFFNWPGQALGYYWGYLHISRLRADAEKKLGARFDIKGFHEAILRTGSVPFTVVDAQVDQWIASRKDMK